MECFFRALLFTTQEPFIVPLLLIGYLAFRREVFARTILILLLSLSINPLLKGIFEVPLPESLGKDGWALPSGHMQSAVVLWGWLALEAKNRRFFAILPPLWMAIGMGLIYFDYHSLADVTAAVLSGGLLLAGFYFFNKHLSLSRRMLGFICTVISLLFYYFTPNHQELTYLLVAPSALFGFSLGWLLIPIHACGMPHAWIQKAVLIALGCTGIAALYIGAEYILNASRQTIILYSGMGLWAGSIAPWLFNRIRALKS